MSPGSSKPGDDFEFVLPNDTRNRVEDPPSRCPWCDRASRIGWHSESLDEYVETEVFRKWQDRWSKDYTFCGLCHGNLRTCLC